MENSNSILRYTRETRLWKPAHSQSESGQLGGQDLKSWVARTQIWRAQSQKAQKDPWDL